MQTLEIEDECWKLSKATYDSDIPEKSLKKLWQIANRLTLAGSYPPVISKEEVELVSERIVDNMHFDGNTTFPLEGATFLQMLEHLENSLFTDCSEEMISNIIDDLHCWLVSEVCRTGWVQKRTKTGPHWTNWVKRWIVLVPERVLFYEKECPSLDDIPKSEFPINKATKITYAKSPYKGADQKIDARFQLSNISPISECEIATHDNKETCAWKSEIQQLIQNTETPVQHLLQERYRLREEHKRKKKDNTDRLKAYFGTNKRGGSFDPGEDIIYRAVEYNVADEENKMKAMFMKLDMDGNGFIDKSEFEKYIKDLGLKIKDAELNLIFQQIDKASNGVIDFNEFCEYFSERVLDEQSISEDANAIRHAFLSADQDGSGSINFTEFSDFMRRKKKDIRKSKMLTAFSKFEESGDGELSFVEFKNFIENDRTGIGKISATKIKEESAGISAFERQLQKTFKDTESDELVQLLHDRWKSFSAFQRQTSRGSVVMTGGDEMINDFLPGNYNLVDLACFTDLPPLEPKHTVIKGVKWVSSKVPGKSGRAIFPNSFDGKVAKEIATNEHLRYYGASFAENQQIQVSLCYRHGIQDFTYENSYLEKYAKRRGCGIETHPFAHLDCPLDSNNGVFVLGKRIDDELHLTAFQVPARHTLYVPPETIHSNDYLTGTWRTMLSDEPVIDHVLTVREKKDGTNASYEKIQLTFE